MKYYVQAGETFMNCLNGRNESLDKIEGHKEVKMDLNLKKQVSELVN